MCFAWLCEARKVGEDGCGSGLVVVNLKESAKNV